MRDLEGGGWKEIVGNVESKTEKRSKTILPRFLNDVLSLLLLTFFLLTQFPSRRMSKAVRTVSHNDSGCQVVFATSWDPAHPPENVLDG